MIEVVAAVIFSPEGKILLGKRPEGKPYPGYWEFPGGKIEAGESPEMALKRELLEEIGIEAKDMLPWIIREFHYGHASVRLHFFKLHDWRGIPSSLENQELSWQDSADIRVSPLLPANEPILTLLSLPPVYAITQAGELGVETQLKKLDHALKSGLRLIQIRERELADFGGFCRKIINISRQFDAKILINSDIALARELGADGIHLNSAQLMALAERPDFEWCAASTHNEKELEQAEKLGLDFVVLGPIKPTSSHPQARGMGWEAFSALVKGYPLPVYAIGGLKQEEAASAMSRGAHGIAMLRGAWEIKPY